MSFPAVYAKGEMIGGKVMRHRKMKGSSGRNSRGTQWTGGCNQNPQGGVFGMFPSSGKSSTRNCRIWHWLQGRPFSDAAGSSVGLGPPPARESPVTWGLDPAQTGSGSSRPGARSGPRPPCVGLGGGGRRGREGGRSLFPLHGRSMRVCVPRNAASTRSRPQRVCRL